MPLIEFVVEILVNVVAELPVYSFANDTNAREAAFFFGLTGVMLTAAVVLVSAAMAAGGFILPWAAMAQVRSLRRARAGDPAFERRQTLFYTALKWTALSLTGLGLLASAIAFGWPHAMQWHPVLWYLPNGVVAQCVEVLTVPAALILFWFARNRPMAFGLGLVTAGALISGFDAILFAHTAAGLTLMHVPLPSPQSAVMGAGAILILAGLALPPQPVETLPADLSRRV